MSSFANSDHIDSKSSKKTLVSPKRRQTFIRLLSYLKPYWWALLLTIVGFAINSATEVWIAKLLQFITDAINQGDQSQQNIFPVLIILL